MTFKELNITEPILKAIEEKGYTVPTPIQEKAIPDRKSTRLNSSHMPKSRMPSSA